MQLDVMGAAASGRSGGHQGIVRGKKVEPPASSWHLLFPWGGPSGGRARSDADGPTLMRRSRSADSLS